jgi:hypothetical protein
VDFQPANYPYAIGYAIKLDRLGDLIIAGSYNCSLPSTEDPELSTMSFGGEGFRTCAYSGYDYIFVQRMDTLGNTEWVHTVGGSTGLGTLQSIAFDAENHIWCAGNAYSNTGTPFIDGAVNPGLANTTTFTGIALELSATGEALSGFLVNSTDMSNVEDLIVAGNGELYLSGWNRGSLFGAPAASGADGFLMRTTPTGTPVWIDRLVGVSDDFFTGIATTTQPNELVGGALYFFAADLAGTALATSTGTTSALVRLDTMGNVLELVQPEVISGYSLIADVQSDLFGNFYLSGDLGGTVRFGNDSLVCASQDMYVCKISPLSATSVNEPRVNDLPRWAVHPNPTQGAIMISGAAKAERFDLLDARGALLRTMRNNSSVITMDLSGLSPGTYVIRDDQGAYGRVMLY